jgi:hypothetical protein
MGMDAPTFSKGSIIVETSNDWSICRLDEASSCAEQDIFNQIISDTNNVHFSSQMGLKDDAVFSGKVRHYNHHQ